METEKDLLMYYHSSLRNVGLFTSVSLALLGYSRFYRGKIKTYNVAFIIISLLFLICALVICLYIIQDLKLMSKNIDNTKYLHKWLIIPQIVFVIEIIIILFGGFTLYRELMK